jgi:hypothetical protein
MVWNYLDPRGTGSIGILLGIAFLIPTAALWRSREIFGQRL